MTDLPQGVLSIIEKLNNAGYRADVVGGAVRDIFIGRKTNRNNAVTVA